MKRVATIMMALAFAACATKSTTDRVLREYAGRHISEFFAKGNYPNSTVDLPGGRKVYSFTFGSGGRMDRGGNIRSNVCKVWIETDVASIISGWRHENCR